MLPASKHFTPIIGIDIHIVTLPPGVPTPLPHPFIGMVMDVANYIPFVGSTVNVNTVPRGTSFTSGILGIKAHIPMGGPFVMAPQIGHEEYGFFGGMKTKAEGELFSPAGFMSMTCNDIGMPISLTPGKKMKPIPSLFLPTSSTIPIPSGPPVIVGGPYVPDLMGLLMSLVMSYGMGALMKGIGKAFKKIGQAAKKGLTKLNKKLQKKFPGNKLSKKMCKWGLEPVNLITGEVLYDGVDFELPGPIPIKWERAWYSFSPYEGFLGHGQHLCYDMPLVPDEEENIIGIMLPDGRATGIPYLNEGESFFDRTEKITLTRTHQAYSLYMHEERHTYHYQQTESTTFRPVKLMDERGFSINFSYNPQGNLRQITDTVGRKIHLDLDEQGRILKVTAVHKGRKQVKVAYTYSEEGDLVGITDAMGKTTRMEFEAHRMVKKTDRNGQSFYWEYDGQNRCTHSWGDHGILEGWIEYKKGVNHLTNSLGQVTSYFFDENTLCTQIKDPLGNSTFFEYTKDFELYREIDEEGNLTGFTYDDSGNRTGVFLPDGSEWTFFFDGEDRLTMTVDGKGETTVYTYDEEGHLTGIVAPDNSVTAFEYNHLNLVSTVINPNGAETVLQYDEDQNLVEMVLSGGEKSAWIYDEWGNCISSQNPNQQSQYFRFDPMGRVTQVRMPDSNIINLTYNAYDEVVQVIDRHHRVKFAYTPLGSLKSREENGVKVQFEYNTEEQLFGIRNEQHERYQFIRNQKGEIVREIGFDGITRHYDRDRAGKVYRIDRPGDRWTEYEYDLNGRITRVEHYDGSWEIYSYDRNGLLVSVENADSEVQFVRDANGRVVEEIQNGYKVENSFNCLGLRTQISSSLGAYVELERNLIGNVKSLSASVNSSAAWEATMKYNALGQEVERSLTGGITSTWKYDSAGLPQQQLVSSQARETRKRTYNWDINSRLKSMTDGLTGGIVKFDHDTFGNLAWAQYETGAFDFKLPDEVGNLFKTKGRKEREYGEGGRLLECPEFFYSYDEEGNLTLKSPKGGEHPWVYHWSGNGMLKEVVRPDRKVVRFEYDGLGRRTAKIFDGSITRWVWDGNVPLHEWKYPEVDRPRLVVDELGEMKWSHEEPVRLDEMITWVFDEGKFSPAAKIVNGKRYSIITDYLGTPVQMFDESGKITWDAEYDIYGKVRKLRVGSLNDCPFRYLGQYEDGETGLCFNRFRYFSSGTGTYLSQDPVGLVGNMPNLYAYVHDSNSWIDPFGLAIIPSITRGVSGEPLIATATVGQSDLGTGTNTNASSRKYARGMGQQSDDAGHILGKQLGGSGGKKNIFAQTPNINRGQFSQFEGKVTDLVHTKGDVKITVSFDYANGGTRPTKVHYEAVASDGTTLKKSFKNPCS